jgi:4-hydroxybenzoate polyprenyltransferase
MESWGSTVQGFRSIFEDDDEDDYESEDSLGGLNPATFPDTNFRAMPRLRTLLVLSRASNLPTVWSNCLAGWWLGGHGNPGKLPFLFAGITFLYVGGMYLNDAVDENFDRQHRKQRPIPTGAISAGAVWKLGLLWLALGLAFLFRAGTTTGQLGVFLVVCILLYDAIHKLITFSPLLMGACRFFGYLAAASIGTGGVTGWAIWCGLALALYIMGLSFLARRESARGPIQYWPIILLVVPMVLAFWMNAGDYRKSAALLSLVLGLWILRSLRSVFWAIEPQMGRAVSGLLAGIVFVDWVAVADAPRNMGFVFMGLFGLALFFQRFIPAT